MKEVEQDKESTEIIFKDVEEDGKKNCSGVPSLEIRHTTIKYSQQYTESSWTNIKKAFNTPVLVSARIELIFFLVAGIVLCFGFSMRIILVTHRCFGCC